MSPLTFNLIFLKASQSPEFKPAWQIPRQFEQRDGWFNASLSFAGPNLAVVTDGGGFMHILDTSSRNAAHSLPWQVFKKISFLNEILHTLFIFLILI